MRHIFRLYRASRSVRALRGRLHAEGVTGKRRVRRDGRTTGGQPFHRGALYHVLQNRIYRGEIVHKKTAYPGKHEAIVDQGLWDDVHAILAANTNGERREGTRHPSLLTGLLVDEQGQGLTPSHAVKKGRRYRYYVSRHLIVDGKQADRRGWRIPAADLEALVMGRLREWLGDPAAITAAFNAGPQDASAQGALLAKAQSLAARWPQLQPHEAKTYLDAVVGRVTIGPDSVTIALAGARAREAVLRGPEASSAMRARPDATPVETPITLTIPAVLKRAGTAMKLLVPGAPRDPRPDPSLLRLLLRAFAVRARLDRTPDLPLRRIAAAEGVVPSYLTRLLRLSYLAPDIVSAIVKGQHPPELTANTLMGDTRLPHQWAAQRALLGFPAP